MLPFGSWHYSPALRKFSYALFRCYLRGFQFRFQTSLSVNNKVQKASPIITFIGLKNPLYWTLEAKNSKNIFKTHVNASQITSPIQPDANFINIL